MRRLLPFLFLGLIAAKGSKKTEAPVPAEPAPAPAAEPAAPAEPAEPAPVATPDPVRNANFNVTITYANGTTKAGHVKGVERTVDFFGDQGWTAEEKDLKLIVESAGSEKQAAWNEVKSIAVTPGKMPDEVDCTYSSDFDPYMYDCTVRTASVATLKDGSKGDISNRHHWRFTMDDGSVVEFQVYKYSIREQDTKSVEFGDEKTENFALYTKLQDQLRAAVKTDIVKSIVVQ